MSKFLGQVIKVVAARCCNNQNCLCVTEADLAAAFAPVANTVANTTPANTTPANTVANTTPVPPVVTVSPDKAFLTDATGKIIDSNKDVWTLQPAPAPYTNLGIFKNNSYIVYTQNLVLLLWFGGKIYQQNQAGGWWVWDGSAFQVSSDPRVVPATPATPVTSGVPGKLAMVGMNIAGGEFGVGPIFTKHVYPSNSELDYFASKGFNNIRVPFIIQNLAPTPKGALASAEINALEAVVKYAQTKNMTVVLDMHNYGTSDGSTLMGMVPGATDAVADCWVRIMQVMVKYPNVIVGMMNEPNRQTAAVWFAEANKVIAAIRTVAPTHLISVPGSYWTGAHAWTSNDNSAQSVVITDPNTIFEVHQYLDSDSSGTHPDVVPGKGATCFVAATQWARANKKKFYLGEFGWADNAAAHAEGAAMVKYMAQNADVWAGCAYWAAGSWWGGYMYSAEPANGVDKPQIKVIMDNLK